MAVDTHENEAPNYVSKVTIKLLFASHVRNGDERKMMTGSGREMWNFPLSKSTQQLLGDHHF